MSISRLKALVEENFADRSLIVVSSREPYVHKRTSTGIKVESPAGGLTSAMDDVLRAVGGTWVAWGSGNADKETVTDDRVAVPPEHPSYTLKRVWLTAREVNNYYNGYSNHMLWPLCHLSLDRVFFMKKFWTDYVKVNRKFADAVISEAGPDSIAWLHDYHLCLAPAMIKAEAPDLPLMHFWHIPWPNWFAFRVCPQAKELIEGLLGNDLLGFQIPLFTRNFMDCVRECLVEAEVDYDNSTVTYKGHLTRLESFPISIDFERFNNHASSRRTVNTIKKIQERFKIEGYLGIGVDRLEYTKGLIKRLQAINLFFEKYRSFRGKFTFVQIAVPTRMSQPYITYKEAVEALVNKINKRFSKDGWRPVVYLDKKAEVKDLTVYYRLADIAVVSSLYDGMNLVAKEFIASQVDEKGMLILSEFAGAAEELEGALLVNPYDVEDFADKIKEALLFSAKKKKARMSALREHVRYHDIYRWIFDIIRAILRVSSSMDESLSYVFDHTDDFSMILGAKPAGPPLVFLDFDGTLTPIVATPDKAVLSKEMRELILRLKKKTRVAVISGRGLSDIRKRIGIPDLIYAGNHGAEIWDGAGVVVTQHETKKRGLIEDILERLAVGVAGIPGVFIEDKGVTVSIHYRQVKARQLADFFEVFFNTVQGHDDSLRITSGKKVFEIRPRDIWNKGDAVKWICDTMMPGRDVVYAGDDTTDEDAYKVLKGWGLSVSIGTSAESDYYLKDQSEVKRFLEFILDLL
ncbi:MAG: bifunctional alpha,alpha-trehalose-phosphate synthase (UDP-forming)/trehalose-phosphatase [Thermodesulfobacteriota bacterium]